MTVTAINAKTLLTIKIDKKLKARAEKTAAAFGLPLGTMVNSLIRNTVESERLDLRLNPSARLRASMREAEREYRSGKLKTFHSVEDLAADLDS